MQVTLKDSVAFNHGFLEGHPLYVCFGTADGVSSDLLVLQPGRDSARDDPAQIPSCSPCPRSGVHPPPLARGRSCPVPRLDRGGACG